MNTPIPPGDMLADDRFVFGSGDESKVVNAADLLNELVRLSSSIASPLLIVTTGNNKPFGIKPSGFADQVVPRVVYFDSDGSFRSRSAMVFGAGWVQTDGGDSRGQYGHILSPFGGLFPGEPGWQLWQDTATPLFGRRLSPAARTYQFIDVVKDFGPPVATENGLDPTSGCLFYGIDPWGVICWAPDTYLDPAAATTLDQLSSYTTFGPVSSGEKGFLRASGMVVAGGEPGNRSIPDPGDMTSWGDPDDPAYPFKRKVRMSDGTVVCDWPRTPTDFLAGKVGEWRLDEASGTRVATVGPNLAETGGAVGWAPGVVGNAASFVGDGRRLAADLPTRATDTTPWTAAFWVKAENGVYARALSTSTGLAGWSVDVDCSPGFDRVYLYDHDPATHTGVSQATPGVWMFVAFGWNPTDGKWLSLNAGNRAKTAAASMGIAPAGLIVGAGQGGGVPFVGLIDEISIWHGRALTQRELSELCDDGMHGRRPI